MAQISSNILQGLSRPSFGQGMFQLGQSLGGIPAQYRAKKQRDEFNEIMKMGQAAMATNDPVNLSRVAQQLAALGYAKEAQQFANAAKQADEKMKQTEGSKGLMAAITGEEGFTPEVEQSLIDSGVTPAQILEGKEKRRSQEARQREQKALTNLTSAALKKAVQTKDPVSNEAFVRSLIDTKDVKGLRTFLKTKDEGSRAKANVVTKEALEKGKIVTYSVSLDPYDGTELARVKIGEKPAEEDDKKTLAEERAEFYYTSKGAELYTNIVTEGNQASADVTKFNNLLNQSEQLAQEYPWYAFGGVAGDFRDFVVSDVAGLGDEITAFRTSLNEVQMQQAIALLPRGPASDRDVQLALNASPDLKDYSPEERIAAIRGMLKIKKAYQEYTQGKIRWVEQTRDPTALGYERYAAVQGLDKKIQAVKTDFGPVIQQLDYHLTEAAKLRQTGNIAAADAMIAFIQEEQTRLQNQSRQDAQNDPTMAVFDIDYLDLLTRRGLENNRYLEFLDENEIKFQ